MKKNRILALLLALVIAASMLSCFALTAAAGEPADDRDGVLQVVVYYADANGVEYPMCYGSGFLINDGYLLTCEHIIMPDDLIPVFQEEFGGTFRDRARFYVTVKSDVRVQMSCVNSSAEMDFAIMKLSQTISNRTYLPLGDSDQVQPTSSAHALGFPWLTDAGRDFAKYTSDDVTVTSGTVSGIVTVNGYDAIQHNAGLTEGNSGGPLVDENGAVIGINKWVTGDDLVTYYYATAINEVREVLDALGIEYIDYYNNLTGNGSDQTETEPTTPTVSDPITIEPSNEVTTVDKSYLSASISEAERKLSNAEYTESSAAAVETAVADAKLVLSNSNATQAEVDNAVAAITSAVRGLEEKSGMSMMTIILIAAAVLVVIIIVVVVILVSRSGKKKNAPAHMPEPAAVAARPAPQPMQQPMQQPAPQPMAPPRAPFASAQSFGGAGETTVLNSGAGETTVLDSGAGETSVLSMAPACTLIREKTGEKINISGKEFLIGKERNRVDYCISDNNSVSRAHARILVKDGRFFVVDQNATNGTFVNNVRAQPRREVEIKDGDQLKLSDEVFVFKANA